MGVTQRDLQNTKEDAPGNQAVGFLNFTVVTIVHVLTMPSIDSYILEAV